MNELTIPPAAQDDPQAFEILRVWAAYKEQHITIRSELNGKSYDFGYLLADLARHGANMYAERENISVDESLKEILEGFNDEIEDKNSDISGEIMK